MRNITALEIWGLLAFAGGIFTGNWIPLIVVFIVGLIIHKKR
jgi:hypothetical protein